MPERTSESGHTRQDEAQQGRDDYLDRFSGLARLYGEDGLATLRNAHLAVIGLGGVGSWAAESFARSGVGELTLVDLDELCVTNTNRQIHALEGTIGKSKVEVMAERIATINPHCRVHAEQCFFNERTLEDILSRPLAGVIDAIDAVRPKCLLLAECHRRGIPVIACGGAGGLRDASQIQITDLARTFNDALLHQVRKNLRSNYGFPNGEGSKKKKFGIRAVFSPEDTVFPQADGCVSQERPSDAPAGLRCDAGLGTATHITATFGLLAAGDLLNELVDACTR